eukprot:662533_1
MPNCDRLLSVFASSTRSHKAIEGVRTVLIFIVLLHHLDILNPALLKENVLWEAKEDTSRRQLLKVPSNILEAGNSAQQTVTYLGNLVYVFNGYLSVTMFLILCGYIMSFRCFKTYAINRASSALNHALFPQWLHDLITLCIKRCLRFIIPLFVLQVCTFLLWHFELIVTDKKIRAYQDFTSFYDTYWKFRFLFLLGSNGALWIMKDLFFAPLVILPVVISVISFDRFKSRWIIMADLMHLDNYNGNSKVMAFYAQHKLVIPIVSFCFLFVKKAMFAQWRYIVDYNLSLTFRSIIWFNITLVVCGYPNNIVFKIFESKYLNWFGKYTFSLYITHIPIYRVLFHCVIDKYDLFSVLSPYVLVIYVAAIITAVVFSVLFYNVIERPSRHLFVNPLMDWFQKQFRCKLEETAVKCQV